MRTVFGCVALCFGFLICGCQTESVRIEQTKIAIGGVEYVTIGVVGASDREAQATVRSSLQRIGIPCVMLGAVASGVEVPLAQYHAALKRLKNEPKLEKKWDGHIHFLVFRKAHLTKRPRPIAASDVK